MYFSQDSWNYRGKNCEQKMVMKNYSDSVMAAILSHTKTKDFASLHLLK